MPRPEKHLDPDQGAVQRFAAELRALRQRAGGVTYRTLAGRCGYSASTLSAAAGGRRLPTLEVAVGYAVACGGDELEWIAKWHAAAIADTEQMCTSGPKPPYRGLSSFRRQDADLFFGRTALISDIVRSVRTRRTTVIFGPSGVGKTSLLHAGVLPALPPDIAPVVLVPSRRSSADLRSAVADVADTVTPLVMIDQFEELFTVCPVGEREEFIDTVLALSADPVRRCHVLLSVRSDYFGRCAEHAELAKMVSENQFLVGPMCPEELREAVSSPATALGFSVERALLATVVQEAKGNAGVLPLVSHAMLETWRRRRGDVLTLAGFNAAGGISGAVIQTAEAVYDALSPDHRRLAAELLLRLIAVEENTRRRVPLPELRDIDPDAASLIDKLADSRLVTVNEDMVEITHEAVLTAWPRLRGWIDDCRDTLRSHRQIAEAARIWTENSYDPSALATGVRLELMRAQSAFPSSVLRLSPLERRFLDESIAQAERADALANRRTKRLGALTMAAVVCAVSAGAFAVVAENARVDALTSRDVAISRQTAVTAKKLGETDPAIAAQLAVAGYRIAQNSETRSALLETSAIPMPTRNLGGAGATALASTNSGLVAVSNAANGLVRLVSVSGNKLTRLGTITSAEPGTTVYALALSADGSVLAVGNTASTVTLWNVTDARNPKQLSIVRNGSAGAVERLDITPDGKELAAAGSDGVVRWSITEPTAPKQLSRLPSNGKVKTVAYDAQGARLAYSTDTGNVHLWNINGTTEQLAVLSSGDRTVPAVAFAPDGRTLVTGSHDRTVRAWDITAVPKPLKTIAGLFELRVTTTSYSPDGKYLIIGSSDSSVRILSTHTWTTVQVLPHPDVVTWAQFTDNGKSVVSVATDGALRRWQLAAAIRPNMPTPVYDTPFTANGDRLAIFAEGSAALWDTSDPARPVPSGPKLTVPNGSGAGDISRDGGLLAAGTVSGEVHLFDVHNPTSPRLLTTFDASREEIAAVAFAPHGAVLAAAGRDSKVHIWDLAESAAPTAELSAATDVVLDLSWSPSGRHLAAASADSHVYLFDMTGSQPAVRLDGLVSYAYSATFDKHSDMLAVGGVDGIVLLWDISDPARPRRIGSPINGPSGRILELSFHSDKRRLAAGVIDGTTWLWDIADPTDPARIAVLTSTSSPLNTAAFRPGDDVLIAGSGDQTVWTWHTDENFVIAWICASVGDPITEHEWRTHVPDLPYSPPCRSDGTPA